MLVKEKKFFKKKRKKFLIGVVEFCRFFFPSSKNWQKAFSCSQEGQDFMHWEINMILPNPLSPSINQPAPQLFSSVVTHYALSCILLSPSSSFDKAVRGCPGKALNRLLMARGVIAAGAHPLTVWGGPGQLVQEKGPVLATHFHRHLNSHTWPYRLKNYQLLHCLEDKNHMTSSSRVVCYLI